RWSARSAPGSFRSGTRCASTPGTARPRPSAASGAPIPSSASRWGRDERRRIRRPPVTERARDWPARLSLDPTAFIAPGAVVVGEVALGPRASVWFNSVVRGDSDRVEIGADSNIQDNSTVHQDEGFPALIGARVTVGHRAVVHGCVIEDDCLIGMGAIVLS